MKLSPPVVRVVVDLPQLAADAEPAAVGRRRAVVGEQSAVPTPGVVDHHEDRPVFHKWLPGAARDVGRRQKRARRDVDVAVLTAVENGGAGTVSRRSKMAAHNRAGLWAGRTGATAPITHPFQREAQECTATWRSAARYAVRC